MDCEDELFKKSKLFGIAVLILIQSLGISYNLFSQEFNHSTEVSIGTNQIDKNLRAEHCISKGRSSLKGGVKYSIPHVPTDDRNYVFRNRTAAQKFPECFGIQASYRYGFFRFKRGIDAYGFFDMQLSRISLIRYNYHYLGSFLDPDYNDVSDLLYQDQGILGTVSILEQNIGIGLLIPISKHLFLNEMAGLGFAVGKYPFNNSNGAKNEFSSEGPFPFLRIGLGWIWNSPKQPLDPQ